MFDANLILQKAIEYGDMTDAEIAAYRAELECEELTLQEAEAWEKAMLIKNRPTIQPKFCRGAA